MTMFAAAVTAICFALVWALVFTMLGEAGPRVLAALRGDAAQVARPAQLPVASRRFSRA